MSNLNLLPETIKKQAILKIHYIRITNSLILLFLVIVILALSLFGAELFLNKKLEQLKSIDNSNITSQKITHLNQSISDVSSIQENYVKWSKLLKNFFELVPTGISLQSVNFDNNKKIIKISGHADKRDDFLNFKKNLEKSDLVKKINSPISNLLHQVDFNFTLTAELNK